MRILLAFAGVLLLICTAQPTANPVIWPPWGNIVPSEDLQGIDRFFSDTPPGLIAVHILLVDIPDVGATACQFSAPKPECFGGSYISDTNIFPVTLGDSQTGVSIGFGQCLQVPIHVLTVNYFGDGTTDECCFYWIYPHPAGTSGEIEMVNCNQQILYGSSGAAIINPNDVDCMGSNPVEPTTWGRVKSLYSE
jgi:hypothetical protein